MKVGCVGYGSIGKRHADNAQVLGHEVVVYDPQVRRDVKFERMIYEQCDAIVVATPSPYHEGPLRAAIERGKHVLIEKPISTSIGMLPQLLDIAARKNLVVMMGNNLRFHPCVQHAKEWIDEGKIGRPIWAHFICGQESTKPLYLSDGVILNTGAHEVDMALHLLGPAKVVAANAAFYLRVGTANCDVNAIFSESIADFMLLHDNELTTFFERIDLRFPEIVPGATGADGLATLRLLLDIRKMAGLA